MDNEMREKSREMTEQALFELDGYSRYRFSDHLGRFFKRLTGRKVPPCDRISWPTGLLANALLAYYQNHLNLEISLVIKQALIKYYRRFIDSRQKILSLENMVAGYTLIDIHQITGDEQFKLVLDEMVKFLKRHAVDSEGSLPYRPAQNDMHIYAEGIGKMCPFLCKYGHTYEDPSAISLAVKQIKNFFENGMDSNTGLPYHGYEYKSHVKHGIIGWGQACGWLMIGLVDSLIHMGKDHPDYDELKQYFRRLVDKVEAYQREDSFYPWQLPAKEGSFDVSATAMILYAIARGIEHEILIGIHRSRLLRGRDALVQIVDHGKLYHSLTESGGFGIYPPKYDAYPWSLGPALSLFSINIRVMKE